jgi:PAS domain S-box-containing protein
MVRLADDEALVNRRAGHGMTAAADPPRDGVRRVNFSTPLAFVLVRLAHRSTRSVDLREFSIRVPGLERAQFLTGPGETTALARARNWAATPLGPIERWPAHLRAAVEACLASAFPSFVWWGRELVQLYNDAAIPIVGASHPATFGRPAREAWVSVWDALGPLADRVLETGETISGTDVPFVPERSGSGTGRRFSFSFAPARDTRGLVVGVLITAFETTAAVRTASALRASEEKYRSLFEAMGQGYVELVMERDREGRALDYRFVELNPAFERLIGVSAADVRGRLGREVVPGLDPWWTETFDRIVRSGKPESFEREVAALGRWYAVYVYPAAGDRFTVLYEDITERKDAEQALRESEALLAAALAALPVGIVVVDQRGDVVLSNPVMRRYLPTGLVPSRDPARHWRWRAWHDDGRPVEPRDFPIARALRGERTVPGLEILYEQDDGVEVWTRVTGVPILDARGRVVRALAVVTDIDALKRGAEALRRSEARQAYLVRLGDALRTIDEPAVIQHTASRVLREQLGADRAIYTEAHGPEDFEIVATDGLPEMPDMLGRRVWLGDYGAGLAAEFRAGRTTWRDDVNADPANGDAEKAAFAALRIRAWSNLPLVKRGRVVAMLSAHFAAPHAWTAEELALLEETAERTWATVERARAEAALRDADRRKDEFLATVAHELRNPLAPLRNGLQIVRRTSSDDPEFARVLCMMDRQLSHLVRLVDDLLDIGRISAGKIELRRAPVALGEVLATSVEASRASIDAHGHEFVADGVSDDLVVDGDFDRLAQVFSNLLTNAAKYTGRGGCIRLESWCEAGTAVVRVVDNGIGIPPEDLSHVFDLFSQVRTHQGRAEGGLGIGLALARRLVQMHGGSIEVESDGPGKGSTFCVRLPCIGARS